MQELEVLMLHSVKTALEVLMMVADSDSHQKFDSKQISILRVTKMLCRNTSNSAAPEGREIWVAHKLNI